MLAVQAASNVPPASCSDSGISMLQARDTISKTAQTELAKSESWINVCYFTNWARYRAELINTGKDVFEMGLDANLCTHFMYGFATVAPGASNGGYDLKSNDPNADHPSGDEAQEQLCPAACNDPDFTTDWSDPNGVRCDWPCNPSRTHRGYEGLTVGMKAKNPSIKALISVGGWNFNDCAASESATFGQGEKTCEIFSEIAADENKVRLFAQNIIDFCHRWGFDGFDLDWEYPVVAGHNDKNKVGGAFQETPQDYTNYISMLRILKEEFQKASPPLLLTAAVGVGKSTVDTAYDIQGMSEHLDLINLMTYDLHGAWETRTGCNANLYATDEDTNFGGGVGAGQSTANYPLSVSWAVQYWLDAGAPASKLTIGLATYGRGWKLSDPDVMGYNANTREACSEGESTKEAGYRSYYEIQDTLTKSGATAVYDEARQCPYVVYDGEWIGYDNERSICAKLAFARGLGLAGSMVWALDLDNFAEGYPLISLMSDGGDSCGTQGGTTKTGTQTTPAATTTAGTVQTTTMVETTSTTTTTKQTSLTETSTTPARTQQSSASTTSSSTGLSCIATEEGVRFGGTDAACTAACTALPPGMWPCSADSFCICGSQTTVQTTTGTTGTMPATTTTATTAATTSRPTTASTTTLPSGSCLAAWAECYDEGEYLGSCCSGYTCEVQSFYYGQCVPA